MSETMPATNTPADGGFGTTDRAMGTTVRVTPFVCAVSVPLVLSFGPIPTQKTGPAIADAGAGPLRARSHVSPSGSVEAMTACEGHE